MNDPSGWIQQFCVDLAAAQIELRRRGIEISDSHAQEYLAEILGFGQDTTRLLHRKLPPTEIVRLVVSYCERQSLGEKIGEVQFEDSLIPEGVPRLLLEKEIKFKGEIWTIHKNDADPFPSNPHAHNYAEGLSLHLGDGRLFRKRKEQGRLSMKKLLELRERVQEVMSGVQLPDLSA